MYIDHSDSLTGLFIVYAIMGPLACLLAGMGWAVSRMPLRKLAPHVSQAQTPYDLDRPHPQAAFMRFVMYLMAVGILGIPLLLMLQDTNSYNRLELSPDGKTLTVSYPRFHAPQSIPVEDLQALEVNQIWLPRGQTHQYWWRVAPVTKGGKRFDPNWEFSLRAGQAPDESFRQLETFVNNAGRLGLPLKYTFKDPEGVIRDTDSMMARPNDREIRKDEPVRLFP